ncbi:Holliday junction resolvase RuvX [bacterium]|jgi:putative holliday junction resolvase|nr:Holliday junction resolvase RuvX [bacterium]MBT3729807.1 Holliday junction resolvase RuvX [bacterium]MBT4894720.1 Holliday junction resolvase RuvX [bacterium]
MKPQRILGVDFGTKKVGIAVSDENGNFALPKVVLQNDKDLIGSFQTILKEENIGEIVIGESINYKGEENLVMKDVKRFIEKIKEFSDALITLEPEFLTSSQVRNTQGDGKMIDASAAALILQSSLDKRNNK